MRKKRYFSISVDLIRADKSSPIDLFINSSTIKGREKFVRVHHRGKNLSREELNSYLNKYHQLYAQESQRKLYLREIFSREDLKDTSKVEAMKSVTIDHLKLLFKSQDNVRGDNLFDNELMNCRDSVVEMIDFISEKSLYKMQKTLAEVYTHDSYTYDHSVSVSFYSIIFLKFLKPDASQNDLVTIGLGGLLHDLGKKKISTSILNSSGQLTEEQFKQIKKHPEYGQNMISACNCSDMTGKMLGDISKVIIEHHENVNGTGYPHGLNGEQISLYSKIVAITDFFDAITSYRSYHEPLNFQSALSLMENSVNKKIDERLFNVFKKCVGGVISKGKSFLELPDDFDPCQPQDVLPFKKREPKLLQKDFNRNSKKKKAA